MVVTIQDQSGKPSTGHVGRGNMRYSEISEDKSYQPPTIEVGDEVKVGKFKNRRAEVKGITTDENNQPVLKTTRGDQKLFKPRISKLEDK
jgi:hypothetical protein